MQTLKQGERANITLTFTKADGSPGQVEGAPTWALSAPELGALTVAEDGMSAVLRHAGVGTASLTVNADGDLGAGVFPIVLSEDIEFAAPLGATGGSFSFVVEQDV